LSSSPSSGSDTADIFAPKSKPYKLSYEDHIKRFWKWIISLPKDRNPWYDETGATCTSEQPRSTPSVFYLGGNGGGRSESWKRTCTVPHGKGLFIPVMVVEISEKDFPGKSITELRKIAKKDQDSVTDLYLKINNREYNTQELRKYRKSTGQFSVEFPENAIFGASPGKCKAVADGHYIITKPLPIGNHTIHYKSELTCTDSDCLEREFTQDIKYNINVK
jgi:hypothetical protein